MEIEPIIDLNTINANEILPIFEKNRNITNNQEKHCEMETEVDGIHNKESARCQSSEFNQDDKLSFQEIESNCTALENNLKRNGHIEKEDISKSTNIDVKGIEKEKNEAEHDNNDNKDQKLDIEEEELKKIEPINHELEVENPVKNNEKNINEVIENGKFKRPNKDLAKSELEERYQPIRIKLSEEIEIACLICLEEESYEDDIIVICDLYPDDESAWYCARCSYLLENDLPFQSIQCEFCPEMKGPIKRIKENSNQHWAHMLCVNWIPEMYYLDEPTRVNVKIEEYWEKNCCGRKTLVCDFCKIKYGDPIQCDDKKCVAAFHATCAQNHGLICSWSQMADLKRKNDEEYYYPIYCKKHMKAFNKKMFAFSNKIEKLNMERKTDISFMLDPLTTIKPENFISAGKKSMEKEPKTQPKSKQRLRKNNNSLVEEKGEKKQGPKERNHHAKNSPKSSGSDQTAEKREKHVDEKTAEVNKSELNKEKKSSDSTQLAQIPIFIKAKKSASFVNSSVENNHSALIERIYDKDDQRRTLYKFREEIANLINFNAWADEKEMKKVIQKFIKDKGLYDKETEKLNVSKDPKLRQILGVSEVHRTQIFSSFEHYMVKKSPEKSGKKRKSSAGNDAFEKDIGQIKEKKIKLNSSITNGAKIIKNNARDQIKDLSKKASPIKQSVDLDPSHENKENGVIPIRKGSAPISDKGATQRNTGTEAPPKLEKRKSENIGEEKKVALEDPKLKKSSLVERKKEHTKSMDTSDFMNEFSFFKSHKPPSPKFEDMNLNASSFMQNFLGSEKAPIQEKTNKENKHQKYEGLSSLINRSNQVPFRRPMNWFVKTEQICEGETIFSPEILERLWPKGAEMLF